MNGIYTMLLGESGRIPRPVAIFGAETDRSAGRKAKSLKSSGILEFAERSVDDPVYALRRTTKSEAILLFSWLESMAGADSAVLGKNEIERMVSDREKVMVSFWVMLWEDPSSLRTRWRKNRYGYNTGSTGSGAGSSPGEGGIGLSLDLGKKENPGISEEKRLEKNDADESENMLNTLLSKMPEGDSGVDIDIPF